MDQSLDIIDEQVRCMVQQESQNYNCPHYLDESNSSRYQSGTCIAYPNAIWRRKICEWSYKVVDHFGLDREIVNISLNYLDRYLGLSPLAVSRRDSILGRFHGTVSPQDQDSLLYSKRFQLCAISSLYLSIKLHGDHVEGARSSKSCKLGLAAFVDLSRGQFTAEQIQTMELKLLDTLQWRVNPPTSVKFATYFLHLLPIEYIAQTETLQSQINSTRHHVNERVVHVLHELSRYLCELSICVYSLSVVHKASVVAFASILTSISLIDPSHFSYKVKSEFLEKIARVTNLHPEDKDVTAVVESLKDVCPDITDHSSESVTHPIAIARTAGFLVETKRKPKNDLHSPKDVFERNAEEQARYCFHADSF